MLTFQQYALVLILRYMPAAVLSTVFKLQIFQILPAVIHSLPPARGAEQNILDSVDTLDNTGSIFHHTAHGNQTKICLKSRIQIDQTAVDGGQRSLDSALRHALFPYLF